MKLVKLLPIMILALVLTAALVRAAHIPEVLLNPSEWAANTEKDIYLSVKNANGDNIVKVEIVVPETSDQKPIYIIGEIGKPAGWTYETRSRANQDHPYKIIWSTSGTGINLGESLDFGFTAKSPASGQYEWNWATTDAKGGIFPGKSVTKVSKAPISYLKIFGVPEKTMAGNLLKITVKVYGGDDSIKTDYTGTISFTTSDVKAILPKEYTFSASDAGSKDFFITYKTVGDQTFTVTDWSSKITQKSVATKVEPGTPTSITIVPENSQANPDNTIEFKAVAKDKFDNIFDVTSDTKWSTDKEAGGSWNVNIYTAKNEGIWTVTGTYNSMVDGTYLTVTKGAVTPTPIPTPTPTPTPTPEPTPEPTPTPTPLEEMNIETKESLTVAPGANETFIVTVNNVGTKDLTDVSLTVTGVPSEWITVYPFKITIEAGTSRDFLVVLGVPANETESKKIELKAQSLEGIESTKSIDVTVGTAPTGLVGLSKNLLNLGIVIVAVAALVLIAWELWFRKPK